MPKKSNDDFIAYIAQILQNDMPMVRIPLSLGQSHLRRVKLTVAYPVSSNGHLLISIPIAALAAGDTSNTWLPNVLVNSSSYNPNVNTNVLGAGIWTDGVIHGTSGLNLESYNLSSESGFQTAAIVSAHISVSVTGTSMIDKKGRIYMAEDLSNSLYCVKNEAVAGVVDNIVNRYTIANITKLRNMVKTELSAGLPELTYHYIPEYGHGNIYYEKPGFLAQVNSPNAFINNDVTSARSYKHFILIASGCSPGTSLELSYEFTVQIEPGIVDLNSYPVSDSTCYISPDAELRYLAHNKNFVFSKTGKISPSAVTMIKDIAGKHYEHNTFSSNTYN